ncbi:MAG: hypothetical protein ACRDIB_01080 [Ardenticatenaceae bacterium]
MYDCLSSPPRRGRYVVQVTAALLLAATVAACTSVVPSRPPTATVPLAAGPPTLPRRDTPSPSSPLPPLLSTSTTGPTTSEGGGISPEEAAQIVPLPPARLLVEVEEGRVVLRWRGTGGDLDRYDIYRKESEVEEWQSVAAVPATEDNTHWYEWEGPAASAGTTYIYGIEAVSLFGTSSPLVEADPVAAP